MNHNNLNIHLLYNDPNKLIEDFQPIIRIIVGKFVRSGYFKSHETDDIIQSINVKLLDTKIKKMQAQYNYSCYLSTYFSKVVYNLCLELKRKMKRVTSLNLDEIEIGTYDSQIEGRVYIEEELKKLSTILKLYHKSQARLELCLKLIFRISLRNEDVRKYCPHCSAEDFKALLGNFGSESKDFTDKEIYEIVTPIFNKYEGKKNSADALRKWVKTRIDEIIKSLNGIPKQANYDMETLKILVRKFFETDHLPQKNFSSPF